MSKAKPRNPDIFGKDPRVTRLFKIASEFYGLDLEEFLTKKRKGDRYKVACMIQFQLSSYGYSQEAISRYFGVTNWNVHLSIDKVKQDPDWMNECLNVFG